VEKVRVRRRDMIIGLHLQTSRTWLWRESDSLNDTVVDPRGASVSRFIGAGSGAETVMQPSDRQKM